MESSEKILFARRRFEEIQDFDMVEDLCWDDVTKQWYILFKISLSFTLNKEIPKESMWYITCSSDYPDGEVNVYPAIENGIMATFNHQSNNGITCTNGLWRKGKLCLVSPYDNILTEQTEPHNFEDRLLWNAQRAVAWVQAAARNKLIKADDYYEIPDFLTQKLYYVISNEDCVSMLEWEDAEAHYGYVDLFCAGNSKYFVGNFTDVDGKVTKGTKWGSYVNDEWNTIKAGWILLSKEPVINNWQAPNTFGELKNALHNQGVDLKCILEKIIPRFRDKRKHILMIGFPIPEKVGGECQVIHWESILLPVLSYGNKYANGFRSDELGWKIRDFRTILKKENTLEWLLTENWDLRAILNRGHFKNKLTTRRVLLLGAGSLASYVGEQLVRGGITNITVMDDDIYKIGNSARHILSIESVGKFKAEELAKHYNSINPCVNAKAVCKILNSKNASMINDFDIIIDCTANNEVLKILSQYENSTKKIFISISFGYKANTLFFAYQKTRKFDLNQYHMEFKEKLYDNQKDIERNQLPWEGIGCWSPVFPALASDVQLIATFATNLLKKMIEKDIDDNRFYIYEREIDEDGVLKSFVRV